MEIRQLCSRFSDTTERREKAIFNTLLIAGNRLQTIFDSRIPEITLKQFLLLSTIRQSEEKLSFTQLGSLLGCSRQNIKKLAQALEKKGFVTIEQSKEDPRAFWICPTERVDSFFRREFSPYQEELKYLFQVYTEEEIQLLFTLLVKLYDGIDNLEEKTRKERGI